jgi:hypothetical protein
MADDDAGRERTTRGSAPAWPRPRRRALVGLVLCTLGACRTGRDRPAPTAPRPAVKSSEPDAPAASAPGRYLISLDPWKTKVSWFCFKNLKNLDDPSVCVQSEEECKLEQTVKKNHAAANGVAFEGSGCKPADDPHCTFMYVREGRAAPADTTGKRSIWEASEKINTCCNYICSETERECTRQVEQFRSVVLREKDREREQMSCDIPCQRWSAFPAEHDKDRPLVCQRNHE